MRFLTGVLFCVVMMSSSAEEIRVLSGGAAKSFIEPLAAAFPGHTVKLEFQPMGRLTKSLAEGGEGGYVVAPVGRGEIELGIHQISEILPVPGVKLVGPLPPELQKYTVYVAVPVSGSAKASLVNQFIVHLTGPQARERLARAGYTSPE
jgi:molybdate transport system substrate-binding protein